MSPETREHLQQFFSTSNAAFAAELERRGRGEGLPDWLRTDANDHPQD
jgi:hypothetical protein